MQNLLEGDDMIWHCLQTTARFIIRAGKYCHLERSRTTGTSIQTTIHKHLTYSVLHKNVIGAGDEEQFPSMSV